MWKFFPGEKPQLYNLEEDIGEKSNLAARYPEIVEQLTEAAIKFRKKLGEDKRAPGLVPVKQ